MKPSIDVMAKVVRQVHEGARLERYKTEWLIVTKDGTKIIGRGYSSRLAWKNAYERMQATTI